MYTIEITGIPGAGKTTLISALKKALSPDTDVIFSDTIVLTRLQIWLGLIRYTVEHPINTAVVWLLLLIRLVTGRWRDGRLSAFHFYATVAKMYRAHQLNATVFICDEGLSHRAQTLALLDNGALYNVLARWYLATIPLPDCLAVMTCRAEVAVARIMERGLPVRWKQALVAPDKLIAGAEKILALQLTKATTILKDPTADEILRYINTLKNS